MPRVNVEQKMCGNFREKYAPMDGKYASMDGKICAVETYENLLETFRCFEASKFYMVIMIAPNYSTGNMDPLTSIFYVSFSA